jgi:hypothetical protein
MIIGISGKIGSGKDATANIIRYLKTNKGQLLLDRGWRELSDIASGKYNEHYTKLTGWETKKFADKLKDIVCLLINCTREDLEDRSFKETPIGPEWVVYRCKRLGFANGFKPQQVFLTEEEAKDFCKKNKLWHYFGRDELSPRSLLVLLGTECGRQIIHPNIWVNAVFSDYKPTGYESKPFEGSPHNVGSYDEVIYPNWMITDVRFPNEANAIKKRGGILIRVNRPFQPKVGTKVTSIHVPHEEIFEVTDIVSEKSVKTTWKSENPRGQLIDDLRPASDLHDSETSLDNYRGWDHILNNDGSLETLLSKIKDLKL